MKQNEIEDIDVRQLLPQNLENLFNIYENENEQYFYNLLKTVNFPEELDPRIYALYVIKPKDTWPLIAHKSYKSVRLWWLLCTVNRIQNPVEQIPVGKTIKVILPDLVRTVLSEIRTS